MPIPETVGAFAIVPHNDLASAVSFWERLGFSRVGGDAQYFIMQGWSCEVHLTQAGSGPWRVPENHNPFGVFIRTPEVDAIAARVGGPGHSSGRCSSPPGVGALRSRDCRAGRDAGPHRMAIRIDCERVQQ